MDSRAPLPDAKLAAPRGADRGEFVDFLPVPTADIDSVSPTVPFMPTLYHRVVDRATWEWREFRNPSRPSFVQEELDHALLHEVAWSPGERVLDVGCADGRYMSLLRDRGVCVRGVDRSASAVARARAGGHEALVASGDNLPFDRGTFDTVLCHRTLYLFTDPQAVISEFHRVLVEGGRVVFSGSNCASPYARVQAQALANSAGENWAIGNRWSIGEWCRAFAVRGFRVGDIYSCNLVWPLVYRVCDQWLIPNEWMRRYNRFVRRVTRTPIRGARPLGAAMDYVAEVIKKPAAHDRNAITS
ncbi:MAG: hypothetical protein DCC65_13910 [Planctomycetota bacterium]|nr:MAG: hypothetical protein DCC65_13910 [Planctomycetota bacterium]